ncbi:MarR family winged helix-turn-helix transcriptional regulator [Chlorogloea sp. CCALA 695]|uniref:MarR family winged helix-turn-helix transcriptional regulator n=1 Tax=Chlorogloea sp. CCALA 695 TaxID=2107693 RepID=UPI000D050DD0|nr:MarR family transcriptional regulator [Chlorogloea sp. CCALA 695]PSB30975.1 MarR family transcriptional regulator [Chlorogloea sp. CCALA 695]
MGTRYLGTTEEVTALNAYIKLVRATESVSHRLHRHLESSKLTVTQFGVLEALFHLGAMHQRDLAEKLLKSGGNITLVIDNLEKRQLVKRDREVGDRRCISVSLTPAGKQLISDLFPAHVEAILQQMSILSLEEQAELGRLCKKLGKQE